jgi:hypothetical protein
MIKERVQKAIKVIEHAIKNKVTVKVASVQYGYSDTYVKNVKSKVIDKLDPSDKDYNDFFIAYNLYKYNYSYGGNLEHGISNTSGGPGIKSRTLGEVGGVSFCCSPAGNAISPQHRDVCHCDSCKSGITESDIVTCDSSSTKASFVNPVKNITEAIKNEQFSIQTKDNVTDIDWKAGNNYPADHIKTPEELLLAAKIDKDLWAIKDYSVNKWDVTSFKQDIPQTVQNYQVKIRLEKNIELFNTINLQQVIKDIISNYDIPKISADLFLSSNGKNTLENNLLEISIFDLHIGKLCWAGETGENYDSKIARTRFMAALTTIVKRASSFNYERILFPIGNDFFNSDNKNNTTTHGTPQDEDLRWQKTFGLGISLLVDAINLLKTQNVPIDVIVIPGNHDFERSLYLGEVLKGWFNDDLMVNIDNGASPRKYYRYHDVLLGFTHGSEEKEANLPMLMAIDTDSKPLWSETTFHEWHLGHIHRKKSYRYSVDFNKDTLINEEMGVTVRYLSSLTGTEEWHHKKGFIGAVKAADAFIWNDKLGMIAHLNSNIV